MKSPLLQLFFLLLFCSDAYAQAGMWTWVNGDSVPNSPGVFGVQGVPSPLNHPPGFYEPAEFQDKVRKFWLFGGLGTTGYFSDLWMYDPSVNLWTWIKGPGTPNDFLGVPGIQGIPSSNNFPGARGFGTATWVDLNGDFWLYGGLGLFQKSDLWKYNISSNCWTWMNGPTANGQTANHGTKGVTSSSNTPGSRYECSATWIDSSNNLWLFGGLSANSLGVQFFNDLWMFNTSTNMWTWVSGDSISNQPSVYGIKGIPSLNNIPGSRACHNHWTDTLGRFWLFGGEASFQDTYNDMWMYNPGNNEWVWMSGKKGLNKKGKYGMQCILEKENCPSSRLENRSCWTDKFNTFWIYGGCTDDGAKRWGDLWKYDPVTNRWAFISGDTIKNTKPKYGSLGIAGPLNKPGSRFGSVSWYDNNGLLYLFGGINDGNINKKNDLWRFQIDPNCPLTTGLEFVPNIKSDITLFPNPNDGTFVIFFNNEQGTRNAELRILNAMGQIVFHSQLSTDHSLLTTLHSQIKTQLPNGIYSVSVSTNKGIITKRIEVMH